MRDAIAGVYPNFSVDYHNVLLSQGKLHNAGAANAEGNGAGKIKFNWFDNRLHVCSRRLIEICVKHQAGMILLVNQEEKLGMFAARHLSDFSDFLVNWR